LVEGGYVLSVLLLDALAGLVTVRLVS